MLDDIELLHQWREGDPLAGSQLLDRHFDKLLNYFERRATTGIDDLIQQTMLACVEGKERIRTSTKQGFCAYLFGIARNVLKKHYSQQEKAKQGTVPLQTLEAVVRSMSSVLDLRAKNQHVMAALGNMSLDDQQLLQRYYVDEYTSEELARIEGIPPGTVRSRVRLARKKLMVEACRLEKVARRQGHQIQIG